MSLMTNQKLYTTSLICISFLFTPNQAQVNCVGNVCQPTSISPSNQRIQYIDNDSYRPHHSNQNQRYLKKQGHQHPHQSHHQDKDEDYTTIIIKVPTKSPTTSPQIRAYTKQ